MKEPPTANYGQTTASRTEFPSTYKEAFILEFGFC